MPKLVRAPVRKVRSRVFDSARWQGYRARPDDIVIATYSKCGTTWMQRIVCMLVFKSAERRSVWDVSPWPDMRLFGPIEETLERAEAMTHRRFFKSHLPYDALPVYEGVKFIHVARDGRDAAMSLYNHFARFTPAAWQMLNGVSLGDPKFATPYPPTSHDPAAYFHDWIADGGAQGDPGASFFDVENSYWSARHDANMLLVHYNDLKMDRAGEMRRIADFLGIEIPPSEWPALVEAASFEAMKSHADELIPAAQIMWEGGGDGFLHKGTNGRWRDVVAKADLDLYDAKIKTAFSAPLARWLENGRLTAGDPKQTA